MVRVVSSMDQENDGEEESDASWTALIRDAVRDFVDSIADCTTQLATAAERFTADSLRLIDEATTSSRTSADAARKAADEARASADEAQRAGADGQEIVIAAQAAGAEVRLAAEQVAASAASIDASLSATEKASSEVQAAGQRADQMYADVSSLMAGARESAGETRTLMERMEVMSGEMISAAAIAQSAAEASQEAARGAEAQANLVSGAVKASRDAARQAEEASERAQTAGSPATASPVLGPEALTLLERLESDYQLLTSLVQELAGRLASLSDVATVGVGPASPAGLETGPDEEAPVDTHYDDTAHWTPVVLPSFQAPAENESAPELGTTESAIEPGSWPVTSWSTDPETIDDSAARDSSPATEVAESLPGWLDAKAEPPEAYWRDLPFAETDAPLEAWAGTAPEIADADLASDEVPYEASTELGAWAQPHSDTAEDETPAGMALEPVEEPLAPTASASARETIYGRVDVKIAPVPDFDRLLNLDNALSRVGSVQSVTLADYAQDEVTFRIDLASELSATDFAQELCEASGFALEVDSVDVGTVKLRLG